MVDISNFVFTKIKAAVIAVASTAKVEKTYQNTASTFPFVTVRDLDNPETSHMLDYTHPQSHPSWQIDIYTTGGAKETVAKQIRDAIAKVMEDELHMHRLTNKPVDNALDTTIYRHVLRYDCTIDESSMTIYS